MSSSAPQLKPQPRAAFSLDELRAFVEHESDLLDEQRFDQWYALFADDGAYWAPAARGQQSWLDHVSLFYDDKATIKTRVARLNHPMIHCQEPRSHCVRVVSNFSIESESALGDTCLVRSKFIMIEDRPGAERRLYGGRYYHSLRRTDGGLRIVLKRVEITNCDHSFPMLTQPF
jgi:benzoate/toluate 1,2-dioxygenase beta subunit